jgi:tetratricopeptide (TPR) repeat protein
MEPHSIDRQIADFMTQERWRDAIVLCESTPLSAMSLDVLWNWAWAHFKLDELSTARRRFERLLDQHPDHPATLLGLGVVLHRLGSANEAKDCLKRVLEHKDSTTARLTLALSFMEDGDIASAEQVHLEGLKLRPDSVERIEAYADFLSDVNRQDEAATQYSRSKQLRSRGDHTS